MEPLDLAWVAGFFEGEGSIYITKPSLKHHQGARLTVSVNQVEGELLELFTEFGGSACTQKPGVVNGRPARRWTVSGPVALRFLDAIEPYLRSERNRLRVDLARQLQRGKGPRGRKRPPAQREAEDALYEAMRQLNRRGVLPSINTSPYGAEQLSIYDVPGV